MSNLIEQNDYMNTIIRKEAAKKFNAVKHSTMILLNLKSKNKTGFRRAKQKKISRNIKMSVKTKGKIF
jgi:hypothetical protein